MTSCWHNVEKRKVWDFHFLNMLQEKGWGKRDSSLMLPYTWNLPAISTTDKYRFCFCFIQNSSGLSFLSHCNAQPAPNGWFLQPTLPSQLLYRYISWVSPCHWSCIFLKILFRVPCLNNRPDPTLKTFFSKEIVKMYAIFSTFQEISIKIQKLEIAEDTLESHQSHSL